MTAGQRNCYEAIEDCLDCYSWEDVIFALTRHAEERKNESGQYTCPGDARLWLYRREKKIAKKPSL